MHLAGSVINANWLTNYEPGPLGNGARCMRHRECERGLSGAIPDEAGLWIVPDAMSLANSIGIDRKGTRPIGLAMKGV